MRVMLNIRAGDPGKPAQYEGVRFYWAPDDLERLRAHLLRLGYPVSDIWHRDYGQSEFTLVDDDADLAEGGPLVVGRDVTVEEHLVREPAAPTGPHRDAEGEIGGAFGVEQLFHLGGGGVGEGDHCGFSSK